MPPADSKTDTDFYTLLNMFSRYVEMANNDLAHQWGLQQLHLAFRDKQINTLCLFQSIGTGDLESPCNGEGPGEARRPAKARRLPQERTEIA